MLFYMTIVTLWFVSDKLHQRTPVSASLAANGSVATPTIEILRREDCQHISVSQHPLVTLTWVIPLTRPKPQKQLNHRHNRTTDND
jgi:hypothetical protein